MGLKRIPTFPDETGNVLNLIVIYISLPALILLKIPELVFSKELLVPSIMPWGMLMFSAALVLLLSKPLKYGKKVWLFSHIYMLYLIYERINI